MVIWGSFINGYLGTYAVCGDCIPPVALLNHFAHWVTLAALTIFVFILPLLLFIKKSKRLRVLLGGWLLPGALAFGWWYGSAFLPKPTPDVEGIEFTAVTFNVFGFIADSDETFRVIRDMDADLVALQELRPTLERRLNRELADTYPYQVSRVVQGLDGYALLSRYPILEHQIELDRRFDYRDGNPRYIRAVIDIEGQQVVVYVFHTTTPDLPPNFYIPTTYDDSIQHEQVRRFVALVAAESDPLVMLCDCNATPRSRQYALLNRYLDEAHGAQGWGFGLTFPADRPMIRIDYVWYSDDFAALKAKVWPDSGTSDHRPMWARLVLR